MAFDKVFFFKKCLCVVFFRDVSGKTPSSVTNVKRYCSSTSNGVDAVENVTRARAIFQGKNSMELDFNVQAPRG